ncbi:hypothetical protein [Williamsia phyllosphaerae]|uniref:Uncharacterized protein n=1 Tax=Williamsia phyllosphaerae TaxID=885042 RepID=A0ABQ1UED7_9NOCA|nr:hypothetical protein [Williamsia phyllosphaerae]GGF14526.1 hypothetical protein GCM10007298_08250 [Williamsia phyllosphaerae]
MTEYSYPAAIAAMFAALAADSVVTEPPATASAAEPDIGGPGIR